MPVEDFIELCKDKIEAYLTAASVTDEYDIFTIWKDFWTLGSNQDGTKTLDNQRAIFGTTLDNTKYFDFTYSKNSSKLYMTVFTPGSPVEYTVSSD